MNLPNELINIILSFRELNKIGILINNTIHNSYEKDYNPYFLDYYPANYSYHYSFYEWYFMIIRKRYNKHGSRKYQTTPKMIPIRYNCML